MSRTKFRHEKFCFIQCSCGFLPLFTSGITATLSSKGKERRKIGAKKPPREALEGAFILPNMHGNTLILSALLCLKIYLVPAQALAAGWIWDSVPAPLELQFKTLLFFLLIFHHRRKFFYGFRNSFLFLRTPLRNPKKTLDPRSLPYFRHFFPIHVG